MRSPPPRGPARRSRRAGSRFDAPPSAQTRSTRLEPGPEQQADHHKLGPRPGLPWCRQMVGGSGDAAPRPLYPPRSVRASGGATRLRPDARARPAGRGRVSRRVLPRGRVRAGRAVQAGCRDVMRRAFSTAAWARVRRITALVPEASGRCLLRAAWPVGCTSPNPSRWGKRGAVKLVGGIASSRGIDAHDPGQLVVVQYGKQQMIWQRRAATRSRRSRA
jgi:hypothetical protein